MATTKEINEQIDRLANLDILVKTYEEIAATNIRKVRTSVVRNRDFIEEIDKIFQELKASHKHEVARIQARKNKHTTHPLDSLTEHNGKTVAVFLAANAALYGDVIDKTFALFSDYLSKNDCEAAIVGKLGMSMYQESGQTKPVSFFEFPDNGTDPDDLKKVVTFLLQYEKIMVFYGRFKSIVNQEAVVSDIYGEQVNREEETSQKEHVDEMHYLYEPSLEKILEFFEAEIFASIFEQTLNESQLAKNASRMQLLDNAIQNIGDSLKKEQYTKRILAHRAINTKQVNALSGISLWNK